jgi:hypothetical protein
MLHPFDGLPMSQDRYTGYASNLGVLGTPLLVQTKRDRPTQQTATGQQTIQSTISTVEVGKAGLSANDQNESMVNSPAGILSWREIVNRKDARFQDRGAK